MNNIDIKQAESDPKSWCHFPHGTVSSRTKKNCPRSGGFWKACLWITAKRMLVCLFLRYATLKPSVVTQVTGPPLSISPFSFPPITVLTFPCVRDTTNQNNWKSHTLFVDGCRKRITNHQRAVFKASCAVLMWTPCTNGHLRTRATPTKPPSPPPPPYNYFYHSAEKPAQTSQPTIICMQVSPGWSRAKGSGRAWAYSRRPLVCRSHAPRPGQTQSYDASGSQRTAQNEWIMSRAGGKQLASLSSRGWNAKSVHCCFRGHIFHFSNMKCSCSAWKGLPSSLDSIFIFFGRFWWSSVAKKWPKTSRKHSFLALCLQLPTKVVCSTFS